jgi:glycosyltransferase involved in cell wall biosynthesis
MPFPDSGRATTVDGRGPTRVLQLIETGGPGGAERMLVELSRGLLPECRATLGLRKPGWLASQAVASGVPVAPLGAAGDLAVARQVLGAVRARRIDVIHAHEFYMSAVGAAVSRLTGVPLVVTVHGKSYYPDRRRRRVLYRLIARQARGVVTVSQDLRRFFSGTVGISEERVQVIYNGIEPRPGDAGRDPALLEACGVPPDARLVGAVGNLYAVKGHERLIRALPAIVRQHPGARLVILGRGPLRERLEAEARALGVGDRVHLLGYRDDVAQWLGAVDVFASASLSEGLPLSVLEAMAAAKPVVVTDVGGMPEIVRDGETGFVVPVADPAALADRISSLLANPGLAGRLGSAGRRRVGAVFSLDAMVARYRDLYRQALDGGRDERGAS